MGKKEVIKTAKQNSCDKKASFKDPLEYNQEGKLFLFHSFISHNFALIFQLKIILFYIKLLQLKF